MGGLNSYASGAITGSNSLVAGTVSTGKMTNNIMRVGLTWNFNSAPAQSDGNSLIKK
jgi:hypothetical protein